MGEAGRKEAKISARQVGIHRTPPPSPWGLPGVPAPMQLVPTAADAVTGNVQHRITNSNYQSYESIGF